MNFYKTNNKLENFMNKSHMRYSNPGLTLTSNNFSKI